MIQIQSFTHALQNSRLLTAVAFTVMTAVALSTAPAMAGKSDTSQWLPGFMAGVNDRPQSASFSDEDRAAMEKYLAQWSKKHCSGKKSRCVDEDNFMAGNTLPDDMGYKALPAKLTKTMEPVEGGLKYVQVNDEIMIMHEASRTIFDTVQVK